MKMKKTLIASAVAVTMLSQVQAQDVDQATIDMLAEVVVTASKRVTTLNDTPIAVTVVDSQSIELAQIQDLIDLQTLAPSLRVSQQQTTANTNFVIRGFGNGANNAGIEPSVGVFIDGVYRSRSGAALSDLPNLERVEVISGPQSTLFGKNASAGVVSVVTPTPDGEAGGFASASLGDFNAVVLKGAYGDAISDTVAYNVAASYNKRDGFVDNPARGEKINDRNRWQIRGQLQIDPNEKTSIRIIADADEIDEACCDIVNIVSGPTSNLIRALGGRLEENNPGATRVFFNTPSSNEIENSGISAQIDYDFEKFTVSSITSFRNSRVFDLQDVDFTDLDIISTSNDTDIDTFTQEVRFASNGSGSFDWLVGAFYFDESISIDSDVTAGTDFRPFIESTLLAQGFPLNLNQVEGLAGLPQGGLYAAGSGTFEQLTSDNQAVSLFGQVDFPLSGSLTFSLGANYTKDEKEFTVSQQLTELRSNIELPGLLGIVPAILPNTIDLPNGIEDNTTDDDELTYLARLAWAINDDLNVYATYATGFKASSLNLNRDSAPTATDAARLQQAGLLQPNSVIGSRFSKPEFATLYEVGIKGLFPRGSFNVAVFDQEIEDFQTNLFLGTTLVLLNAGTQSVKGLEFDVNWLPTNKLTLGVKGTLLDPIYDDFSANPTGDLSGDQVGSIAEVTLALIGDYRFNVFGQNAFVRGDYYYAKSSELLQGLSEDIASNEVKQLDLTVGMDFNNGTSVSLWGRNLTDHDFLWSAFPTVAQPGSLSGFRNDPRTFGITLRKDF